MSEYINKEAAIDLIESMIADKGVAFNPHKLAMALKDMESVEIPEAKDTDLISRQAAIDAMWKALYTYEDLTEKQFMEHEELKLEDWFQHRIFVQRMHEECMKSVESLPPVEDMGEVSDGYHTFNQLYHQRAVLFATIVNQNKDKAWKSCKHEDGKFCFDKEGEWFIVGIDTPDGSYTYHYEKKYWDLFNCEELDRGKHWDGHTEDDVTRLLSLSPVTPTEQQGHGRFIDADKLLQELFIVDEEEWTTPEIRTILVNAPPVEPKPVCEDCISRADAINVRCAHCDTRDCCRDCSEVEILLSLPPVEPVAASATTIDEVVDFNNMISAGGRIRNLPPVEPATNGYVPAEHAEGGKK